jgi:hypothetical protein
MANLYNAAQNLISFNGYRFQDDDDARKHFRNAIRDEHERFHERVNRWLIVLPSKVKAALDNFNMTLGAVNVTSELRHAGRHDPDPADCSDMGMDLARSYERAVNCIRHHLAVDSLTMGMLREMGIGADSLSVRNLPACAVRLMPVGNPTPSPR